MPLILGAILALQQRTVTGLLRVLGPLARGHWSRFHRVFCRASWTLWLLGKVRAAMVLERIPKDQPVVVPVGDTAVPHKGKKGYGKGRHRDAVRSAHSLVVWLWDHKWVVLTVNVKFPFATRPWALPVLCALYRPKELNRAEGRRHKTPIELARQLVALLMHWFAERKFLVVGDGDFASHEFASFFHRHRRRITLVSRFHPDANLYDPPPATKRNPKGGRPRIKGRKRAAPRAAVKNSKGRRCTVNWYGGKSRRVELISGTGHWYKAGGGLVPLRWVHVRGCEGTHREEYFYSIDAAVTPARIVSLYANRWSIEVTFQEVRAHLGFATRAIGRKRACCGPRRACSVCTAW